MRRRLVTVIVVLLAIAVSLVWFFRAGNSSPGGYVLTGPPPNVVIIVMDTARQDRLSCYGYERDTSPRIQELAGESTLFGQAYSTSSWTIPSHASLFTGLYPVSHSATQENWSMNRGLVTLAEILSERGYETVGIVENSMLATEHGFQQGFSAYHLTDRVQRLLDRPAFGQRSETGNRAVDLFIGTVRDRQDERPFFVFVNLIAPHHPYDSSKQFMDEFVTNPEMTIVSNMWPEYYLGEKVFSPEELTHLNDLYDAELLYTDHLVGLMADELKSAGYWGDTFFILTSDHGENIGDHSHMDHLFSLYETTVKIPLLIHYPPEFGGGAVDDRPVTLVDVLPTVLDATGIDRDDYPCQGLSLLSDEIPEDRAIITEYYWPVQAFKRYDDEQRESASLDLYRRRLRGITVNGRKLVWGGDGRHELFDLRSDPDELANLLAGGAAGDLGELEKRLSEAVGRFEDQVKVTPVRVRDDELNEETKEALRSLGYMQ